MANNTQDRRGTERVPVEIPITYTHINTFLHDYINNISLGGTFIKTSNFLPIGTRLRFVIRLPQRDEELSLNAEVVSVREKEEVVKGSILPQGMGLKFIYDSEEEERRFCEKIDRILRKELGDKLADRLLKKNK
ncbi:MAG: TIGR02266 family protein [Myxococcota bacterium]